VFTIRFRTTTYRPNRVVTMRLGNDAGWIEESAVDVPGTYEGDQWLFELDEQLVPEGKWFNFKFVLERRDLMRGDVIWVQSRAGADYPYDEGWGHGQIRFPDLRDPPAAEQGRVQSTLFKPMTNEQEDLDVIVIGSGMGGGIVAEQLADKGKRVLVLEAGSYLFPVHVANLPRQHALGKFTKHAWHLWDELQVRHFTNAPGSQFDGALGFNLGGRSIFWGGLIPEMGAWELTEWPAEVHADLSSTYYKQAHELMTVRSQPAPPTPYQARIKARMENVLTEFSHQFAPIAVQTATPDGGSIPAGMFSTADLLMESWLTEVDSGAAKHERLFINLNHRVTRLEQDGNRITRVVARDLIAKVERSFRARNVILAAGSIESTVIARMSKLKDPSGKLGVGLTDHPVFFTHFAIPIGTEFYDRDDACKIFSRPRPGSVRDRPYNIVLEIGSDFNQGRFVDRDLLERQIRNRRDVDGRKSMLCEVVFLFDSELMSENYVETTSDSDPKPVVMMKGKHVAPEVRAKVAALKDTIVGMLHGSRLAGNDPDDSLELHEAKLGRAGHEVGTLRMGAVDEAVVSPGLKYYGYDNLYVCDLSVFPTSPAVTPSLTLAALALRLADHLGG